MTPLRTNKHKNTPIIQIKVVTKLIEFNRFIISAPSVTKYY